MEFEINKGGIVSKFAVFRLLLQFLNNGVGDFFRLPQIVSCIVRLAEKDLLTQIEKTYTFVGFAKSHSFSLQAA